MPIPSLVRWSPGDARLSGVDFDGNFGNLDTRLAIIEALGLQPDQLATYTVSADGRTMTLTSQSGRLLATVTLPASPVRVRATGHVAGLQYLAGDIYSDNGTSYQCVVDHIGGATAANDLASGLLIVSGSRGADMSVFRGAYVSTNAYKAFDVVSVGAGADTAFYQTYIDIAASGAQPPAFPWFLNGYVNIPATVVKVTAENKLLSAVVAEIRADIASIKARLTAAGIA